MDAKKARWVMGNLRTITNQDTLNGYLKDLGATPPPSPYPLPALRNRVAQLIMKQGLAS